MEEILCPKCKKGDMLIKKGKRKSMKGEKQRYFCKRCDSKFVTKGAYSAYYKDEIVELTLKLHKSGMSANRISKYVEEAENIKVNHGTIIRWIKSFEKG